MSFFDLYFEYIGKTESPRIFHRWTAVSTISAILARNVSIPFGHLTIYPNQYIMLMGSPGSRKSTAIGIGKKLLHNIGYENFSVDRTSKESLWIDMTAMQMKGNTDEDGLENLTFDDPTELYIVADEFNDFMGLKNDEFSLALSKMWDCPPTYRTSAKHSDNADIIKPTINILGGNTPGNLAKGFGPEAINGGFFSRIIFIHGDAIADRTQLITFPAPPDIEIEKEIHERLVRIRNEIRGEIHIGPKIREILEKIYKQFPGIMDYRFNYYQTRRFTHLLKLICISAAADLRLEINEEDCIKANTMLHLAEIHMPHALGEFGKAKNSDVANTIMEILKSTNKPLTAQDLWRRVSQDLNRIQDLLEIIKSMQQADRIQQVKLKGKIGFLPNFDITNRWENGLIDYSTVTNEEHPAEMNK